VVECSKLVAFNWTGGVDIAIHVENTVTGIIGLLHLVVCVVPCNRTIGVLTQS
jgi:hypothetical protein